MTYEEEDYRVKNAREGRAFYLPGRTVEEIAADTAKEAERRAQVSSRTVALKVAEWEALDTAIPDVIEILFDVGRVFSMLAWTDDLDNPGINSIMRIAARAVRSMEGKEIDALDRLDTGVRHATKGGQ